MSEWIACRDRLPKTYGWYLVVDNLANAPLSVTMGFWDYDDEFPTPAPCWLPLHEGTEEDIDVTHWMPLPEPPEAEK